MAFDVRLQINLAEALEFHVEFARLHIGLGLADYAEECSLVVEQIAYFEQIISPILNYDEHDFFSPVCAWGPGYAW